MRHLYSSAMLRSEGNISRKLVASLRTSQPLMSWLKKRVNWNICSMLVTWLTSHRLRSELKRTHSSKVPSMLVTAPTSQSERSSSKLASTRQMPWKACSMSVTRLTSHVEIQP